MIARNARLEAEWWHTANLLAQTYNLNRPQHKPAVDPYKFHPFAEKPKPRQATPDEIARLFGPDWHRHPIP